MKIDLIEKLKIARNFYKTDNPFLSDGGEMIFLDNIFKENIEFINEIPKSSIVSIIGDFDIFTIACTIRLLSKGHILVPLTYETENQHNYFFEVSNAEYIIKNKSLIKIDNKTYKRNHHLEYVKKTGNGGIIFFSTGTTGNPKAILHSLERFLLPFEIRKKEHRSLGFLLFDHIGGFNTLFHLLFNNGTLFRTKTRTVDEVLEIIRKNNLTLLPTTPTFLRILMCHKDFPNNIPSCISVISYGTEMMHESTLKFLSDSLPKINFRQTYGMSELGILPIKSKSSSSTEITIKKSNYVDWIIDKNSLLKVKSKFSMIGYLNAENPFDEEGWLNTGDIAKLTNDGFFKILGREKNFINVGGLKVLPEEIESIANNYEHILRSKAKGIKNPITGEYIELTIELSKTIKFNKREFESYLKENLSSSKLPSSIKIGTIKLSHRMKQE